MGKSTRRRLHVLQAALTIALPVMLILSAFRTYQELNGQRSVYLQSRVAALAARLETFPDTVPESQWKQILSEEESALSDLVILDRGSSPDTLADLWEGRELFRTESIRAGEPVFRAYVPFHGAGGLQVARIDVVESAADFLVEHARHHLWLAGIGGLMIVALSLVTARSAQRAALAERRQLELQHLASIGEMSATLAHEIRNPLGTIKGFAQLLGEKLQGEHGSLLSPILAESSRLEGLVKDLLLYGRTAQPSFQPVDLRQLAEVMRQHALQLMDQPDRRFETAVSPLILETDPHLVEQVLLNLLRNAIDAVRGQPDGLVRLEIAPAARGAVLRILDNGPGLSDEVRRRLFEPFFTTKASGTGLGLSISRKLVEALGGRLRIENGANGGLVAEISLPQEPPGGKS